MITRSAEIFVENWVTEPYLQTTKKILILRPRTFELSPSQIFFLAITSLLLLKDLVSHLNVRETLKNKFGFRYDTTLRGYLEQHTPSLKESLFLLAQLSEAVVHLNEQQIAHR